MNKQFPLRKDILPKANLRDANLRGADLRGADLRWANLSGANLDEADLRWANLSGANLRWANLSGANLDGANLSGANLSGANLDGANLSGANLDGANLDGANLRWAKNIDEGAVWVAQASIVPCEGEFTAWKKLAFGMLAKLLIPKDARRSNATGRKCRADKAIVLELVGAITGVGRSLYDPEFTYEIGQQLHVPDFDANRWNECAPGIHFYITRAEAEAHT